MSYEDFLIREMTVETPPDRDDACPVCDRIECMCPYEKDFPSLLESAEQDRHHQQVTAAFLVFCVVQCVAFAVLTACCP